MDDVEDAEVDDCCLSYLIVDPTAQYENLKRKRINKFIFIKIDFIHEF